MKKRYEAIQWCGWWVIRDNRAQRILPSSVAHGEMGREIVQRLADNGNAREESAHETVR